MSTYVPRGARPTMLVVELEGAPQVAAAAESLGWRPIFVSTDRYADWLPAPDRAWAEAHADSVVSESEPSFHRLFGLAESLGAGSVLPISLLEPECCRDALLRDHAERARSTMRVIANRPSVVELTYDKWLTKTVLAEADFPVVPGRIVSSGEALLRAADELGAPLVCKPRRDFTGRGVRVLATRADVEAFARKGTVRDLLVEPFTPGAEVSVEIIRSGGTCHVQPVAYKGETRLNAVEHPIYRPRVAPWRPGSAVTRRLTSLAISIATELRLEGAAELEFIVAGDQPYLMEINPRVSGVTRMAMAAGGRDTFGLLARMAAGFSIADVSAPAPSVAIGLPITVPTTDPRVVAAARAPSVRYVKPITWMPLLPIKGSVLLAAESTDALLDEVQRFAPLTSDAYLLQAYTALEATRGVEQVVPRAVAVEAAYETAYAPRPVSPALLPAMLSAMLGGPSHGRGAEAVA